MASASPLLLTLSALSLLLSPSFSYSRKELRNKEGLLLLKKENASSHFMLGLGNSVNPNSIDPTRVVQISWQPRVFLYREFLSSKECDYLISLAYDVNEKSFDAANGRPASETSLDIEDDIVAKIEERISLWTFLPKENSKPLQVKHYELEQDGQNLDYFTNKTKLESNGVLMATVILYLSNSTQGGQILFPKSELKSSDMSDCGDSNKILQPVKGNAILFFSLHLGATQDKRSIHSRCPILKGDMWSAIKYFYAKPVGESKDSTVSDDGDCIDEDDSCAAWAAMGECQRNPVFMVGSQDYYGTCRKSCHVC